MALEDHVQITIIAESVSVARAGFGLPLILSHAAPFSERVRLYPSQSAVLEDFASSSPEARVSGAMFRQTPRPQQVAIGRLTVQVTQEYTSNIGLPTETIGERAFLDLAVPSTNINTVVEVREIGTVGNNTTITFVTGAALSLVDQPGVGTGVGTTTVTFVDGVTTVAEVEQLIDSSSTLFAVRTPGTGTNVLVNTLDEFTAVTAGGVDGIPAPVYTFDVAGEGFVDATVSYEWQPGDTATDVAAALVGLLNAVSLKNYTAANTGAVITVTANSPNGWFSLSTLPALQPPGLIEIFQSHVAPLGFANDANEIQQEFSEWYWLVSLYNSQSYVEAVANWVSTLDLKMYIAGSSDTRDLTTSTGTNGTLDNLASLGFFRAAGFYHHVPAQFADASLVGNLAPREPGSWTAKFKTLVGVEVSSLTATQVNNLLARNANFYESTAGIGITREGTTSLGPELIRGFIDDVINLDWVKDDMQKGIFEVLAGAPKIPRTDSGMVSIRSPMAATLQRAVIRQIASDNPAPTITIPLVATMTDLLPRGVRASFQFTLAGAIHEVEVQGTVEL